MPSLDPVAPPPDRRLTDTLTQAVTSAQPESPAVCDAVGDIVAQAKAAGAPPEHVLGRLKRVLAALHIPHAAPTRFYSALTAWVVRCFLQAFYRPSE
jgi:hypothetical protein